MPNTITTSINSLGANEATYYFALASDGSEETALVVYDSSAVATELAKQSPGFTDPLKSRILEIYGSCNAASTARIELLWDATTDVQAIQIPVSTSPTKGNFRRIGGLINSGGSGKTGDILLTTTGLAAGDTLTIILTVGAY